MISPPVGSYLKPKFSLDFAGTKQLGPRVTFARASNGTYFDSTGAMQTATTDIARFDHNPATGQSLGLLVEEARTNFITNGQGSGVTTFLPTGWAQDQTFGGLSASSTSSVTVGALGLFEFSVVGTTSNANRMLISPTNSRPAVNPSTTYAFTYYAKIVAGSYPYSLTGWLVWYNSAGSVITQTNIGTSFPSGTLTRFGGTATAPATAASVRLRWDLTGYSTSGTAVNFTMQLGGAQLETGAFGTTYIPTSSGQATREADIATITGANFSDWWKPGSGIILARARQRTVSGTRPWMQFDDGTADNLIAIRGNTTNPELYIKATTDQAQIDAGTIAANTSYRFATAWDTNNCAASINSGVPVVDGAATIPTVTQARLGADGTNYLNGYLESIEYYDTRLLNSTLQVMTSSAGYPSIIGPIIQDTIIS